LVLGKNVYLALLSFLIFSFCSSIKSCVPLANQQPTQSIIAIPNININPKIMLLPPFPLSNQKM
jgi:hypothetical protein